MTNRRRKTQLLILLAALSLLLSSLASVQAKSKSDNFDQLVKLIESRFHAKRKRSRLMGLAKLGVKIARPADIRNFKLAVFEEGDFSTNTDDADFGALVRGTLATEWRSLAQVRSQASGEQSYTYLREAGANFKILIISIERREAIMLEVEIPPEKLLEWMRNPNEAGKSLTDEMRDEPE